MTRVAVTQPAGLILVRPFNIARSTRSQTSRLSSTGIDKLVQDFYEEDKELTTLSTSSYWVTHLKLLQDTK